jgi:hypothetical protein
MSYLKDLMLCLRADTDENELDAFKYNDSREIDEHSPENLDLEMNRFNNELQEDLP